MQSELPTSLPNRDIISPKVRRSRIKKFSGRVWRDRWLYLLLLPGLLFYIIYIFVPLAGSIIAFQDYSPFLGFLESPWVGLKHFQRLIEDPDVLNAIKNTLVLNLLTLLITFPIPIILAMMLDSVRQKLFKQIIQTLVYLPYFISWVVIVGIWYQIFGSLGLVNQILVAVGWEKVSFLTSPDWFRFNYIVQNIWHDSGWGTIIYLAALAGISQELYEVAAIDGANRWQRMWHITLPGIRPIMLVVFTINLGRILTVGFEHVFLLLNSSNESVAQVLDTFVYFRGIVNGNFSFATAVGLVKGVVGLILVVTANQLAKRFGEEGIF